MALVLYLTFHSNIIFLIKESIVCTATPKRRILCYMVSIENKILASATLLCQIYVSHD